MAKPIPASLAVSFILPTIAVSITLCNGMAKLANNTGKAIAMIRVYRVSIGGIVLDGGEIVIGVFDSFMLKQ